MPDISQITINSTTYDIKDTIARSRGACWYGTSSTSAGTQTKIVTCSNFELNTGCILGVKFTNANTYSLGVIKLNVNSTGAKNVYIHNAATSINNTIIWPVGALVYFMYDGSYWRFMGWDVNGGSDTLELNLLLADNGDNTGTVEVDLLQNGAVTDLVMLRLATDAGINLELAEDGDEHGGDLILRGSYSWNQVAQKTGTTSATIDLTSYSEVLVVADVLRNSAHHFFSCNFPVACISSTAAEYKLGGYVAANASTSGGAWCSMSLTSFAGVGSYINNTSFINSTTWTVYAR